MTTLLIKDNTGKVYESHACIHALAIELLGLQPENVIDTGFLEAHGREIWLHNNPKHRR